MNLPLFLFALAAVESGGNDNLIGSHGERGRYQIRCTVWKQHAVAGYFDAHVTDPQASTECAITHIKWLWEHGVPETPLDTAYAWRHGLRGWERMHESLRSIRADDPARRVKRAYVHLLVAAGHRAAPGDKGHPKHSRQ